MNEQSTSTQSTGKKLDGAKLPVGRAVLAYFPRAIEYVARVSKFGKEKYGVEYEDQNWSKVENADLRYEDAVARHTLAPQRGERNDPESGLLHLGHRAWDALATLELALRLDDRNQAVPQVRDSEPCGCKTVGMYTDKPCITVCAKHMAEIDLPSKREGCTCGRPCGRRKLPPEPSKREFKVGELVRVRISEHNAPAEFNGATGTIGGISTDFPPYRVNFTKPSRDHWFYSHDELEHV